MNNVGKPIITNSQPSPFLKVVGLAADDDDDNDPVKLFQKRGKWWELIVWLPFPNGLFIIVSLSLYISIYIYSLL